MVGVAVSTSRTSTSLLDAVRRAGAALTHRRARRIRAGVAVGLRIGRAEASADYVAGTNELPVQVALCDALEPGATFLDIGANVGFFSLLAGRLVGAAGHVVALEPVPANAARIRANARRNRLANIDVIEAAAAASNGRTTLLLAEHPGGAVIASAGVPPDPAGSIDVDTVTVDELLSSGRIGAPDVVKIDVEGAEPDVLAGMSATLAASRPIVLCEVDAGDEESLVAKRAALTAVLESAGYDVEVLDRSYGSDWLVDHLLARPVGQP